MRIQSLPSLMTIALLASCGPGDEGAETTASVEEPLVGHEALGLSVFAIDNQPEKNSVLAYKRWSNGRLELAGTFPTGGAGTGTGLGSQGAVVLSRDGRWLFAVSAGSNEISVFEVRRSALVLRDIVPSGGSRPVSVSQHRGLVYTVNAGSAEEPGNLAGFTFSDGRLTPIPSSKRALSQSEPTAPAQIQFSPGGEFLIVTEKATNRIDSYQVLPDGTVADQPLVTDSSGATPFGFAFTRSGLLVVSEAAGGSPNNSTVSSYWLLGSGAATVVSPSVPTEQTAACWTVVSRDGRYAYTTNTGSGTISGFRIHNDGSLTRFDDGGATAVVGAGPTDMDFSDDGRFLYVLNGAADSISVLRFDPTGGLRLLATSGVSGLPASALGLTAR